MNKQEHTKKATRNNGFLLQVPKVRLQLTKSCFRSMVVKFYNSLTAEHNQAKCTCDSGLSGLDNKVFLNCTL